MSTKKQKSTLPAIIAPAQYQLEPFHAPTPAAKTVHYPLPLDRHIKPKLLNLHIKNSTPLIVFSDMNVGVEEMGWGGWQKSGGQLDEWDEALINEDIFKLMELDQQRVCD